MIAPSGPGGRQDPLELGGAGSSAVARKTLTARRGPNSGQDSPKKHATPRALPCRALEVDAHPLAITSAFGELVYSVLIRRHPTRHADFGAPSGHFGLTGPERVTVSWHCLSPALV